ncbi:T9SS type A sorting domain-containing protein [Taibaiella soli]|uniref:PKD domain-containing protein n=1 Tax=Taibaiella soli TaxID=1649169 RepID=A0A2W2AFJ1_9BACT|nr:T9SS type A sorting domain-containing protein [Taibaiella soli]PZF72272.1 hypothetical protein DN068_12990 [Taibaiella soli]
MTRKSILFVSALTCLSGGLVRAQQVCGTDEFYRKYRAEHPEVAVYEKQLQRELLQNMKQLNLQKFARTTNENEDIVYDVPIVFHIIHDYGAEYVNDTLIYATVQGINEVYSKTNLAQMAGVIPTFAGVIPGTTKDYIGKANIQFHLPTKDPNGNPTHGITRRRSYLASNGDENSKFDQWAPDSYANIWIVARMSANHDRAAAYTVPIPGAAANPYIDGINCLYDYTNRDNTLSHELGHYLSLDHPWGNTNNPDIACGDDGVDDTPPTKGHNPPPAGQSGCTPANLYDTVCTQGYFKKYSYDQMITLYGEIYPGLSFNQYDSTSFIDYPDTTNSQNVMDYTYCSKMFTYGQTQKMRAALISTVANRNHLFADGNLVATGALESWTDLPPVADFSLGRISGSIGDKVPADKVFGCVNSYTFTFIDRSWNDTIAGLSWTFSNGAANATASSKTVTNTFSEPGWVDVTLTATGNNGSGSNTIERKAVYVADLTAINPDGYLQEFNPADIGNWPMFNYYNNNFKWSVSKHGMYDTTAICYNNFDPRANNAYTLATSELLGTPAGDYDDMFTPAFDLSGSQYAANCNLNFMSSSTSRTTVPADMRDSLEIWYSTDCANSWKLLTILSKGALHVQGISEVNYSPAWPADWTLQSINIPAGAKSNKTFFRFRYKPGAGANGLGSGNNFYMDRLHINNMPTGVNSAMLETAGVTVAPNPTKGNANLYVKGGSGRAEIQVADIAGKVVYRTQQALNGNVTVIDIPAASIAVKGMYLVQVISNQQTRTEKLVVY